MPQTPAESDSLSPPSGYQGFLTTLLSNRERLFGEVVAGTDLRHKLRYAVWTLVALAAFYGSAAGAYAGAAQAGSAAIKLPLLIVATLVVCFPAFYVVQILV